MPKLNIWSDIHITLMALDRESRVLLSISMTKEYGKDGSVYKRRDLADAMDISPVTLERTYLSRLRSDGFIDIDKKVYSSEDLENIRITDKGEEKLKDIWSQLDEMTFTPQNHGIETYVKVVRILKLINNPLDRTFLLHLFSRIKSFDLLNLLESFQVRNNEISSLNIAKSLETGGRKAFVDHVYDTSIYSRKDLDPENLDDLANGRVDLLLTRADAYKRQGKLDQSREIYDYLLNHPEYCNENQVFISKIGLSHVLRIQDHVEDCLKLLDDVIENGIDRYKIAYAKQVKAYTFSQMGQYNDALKLFKSSLNSFRHFGFPLFLSIGYNNRGILHFKMEDYDSAEDDWFWGKKYAMEANSLYVEACIMTNQADIFMKKDQLDKAEGLLHRAEKIFKSFSEYHGMTGILFNRALLHIERGEFEKGIEVLRESEEAHPLIPSKLEIRERREEFMKRAREKGFQDVEKLLNP